jgi:hypothetical protein
MAAPEYVPVDQLRPVRWYSSPDRVPDHTPPVRPSEGGARQPSGPLFGSPGPDQGYGIGLAKTFVSQLELTPAEAQDDVLAGCLGVALKRASLFGRAPVIHDFTVAFTVWGFLRAEAPADLVATRAKLFIEVANPHHYGAKRAIADAVPESTLRLTPAAVATAHTADWRSLLCL